MRPKLPRVATNSMTTSRLLAHQRRGRFRPQAIIGVAKFTHSVFCLSSMVKAPAADKANAAKNKHDGGAIRRQSF